MGKNDLKFHLGFDDLCLISAAPLFSFHPLLVLLWEMQALCFAGVLFVLLSGKGLSGGMFFDCCAPAIDGKSMRDLVLFLVVFLWWGLSEVPHPFILPWLI